MLHGSNDILLIENISNRKTRHPFLKVLLVYLLTVFTAVAVFYVIPVLALVLFIMFSAFHFGEQHWENRQLNTNNLMTKSFYFFYGLFVLMLLFVFNKQEVIEVVKSITQYSLSHEIITTSFILSAVVLILLIGYQFYRAQNFKSILLTELFYLMVFAVVFKVSTLIWGFTIYFILWHSIPSLIEQINFVYGSVNKQTIISYTKKAFPYWLISIIGLAIVFTIFREEKLLYAILFSFIAAVTFPHSLVINKMFKHKKTQPNE
jgi:Brp/Blh family beta-carotene 15,15'-monooxygenase